MILGWYPRPPVGSLIKERNLENSVHDLFCQKDTKQNQQEKKGTWGKVWRKAGASFLRVLSQQSHRGCASFFQQWIVTCVKFCLPGKLMWAQESRVCIDSAMQSPSVYVLCPAVSNSATLTSSTPASSVHVISQTKILEWVAISSSQGIFLTQGSNSVSCIGRWILYHWATRRSLTLLSSTYQNCRLPEGKQFFSLSSNYL